MTTLEECKKALENAEQRMFEHESGNDMYYSSPQYREDKEELEYWKNKLKEFRANINKDVNNHQIS